MRGAHCATFRPRGNRLLAREDEEANIDVAEDGELLSFLDQTALSLRERHMPTVLVLDSLQLNLPSPHFFSSPNPNLRSTSFLRSMAIASGRLRFSSLNHRHQSSPGGRTEKDGNLRSRCRPDTWIN
ncbi:hypothetical protein U1Q18_019116 [Sarracenia purpurea var. burkii]